MEPLGDRARLFRRQDLAQQGGDRAAFRQRGDVARRALQHRDVRGRAGQCGDERDGGGAAADDDDPLARDVEVARARPEDARRGRRSRPCRRSRAGTRGRSGSSHCTRRGSRRVRCSVSPVSVRSAVTCQRASALDQSAAVTRWWKRMCVSTPDSVAVSLMYCRIESPSAIDFSPSQGRNEYPSVCMSESERIPG